MGGEWQELTLGEFVTLQRGHDLPETKRTSGSVPILGSFGVTGWHDEARAIGPGVTVGRSGASFGVVSYSEQDYWPLNTALYVNDFHGNHPKFAYYFLKAMDFGRYNSGSAQPSLNRNHIHPIPVHIPEPEEQKAIAHILGSLDDKIELHRQMNATLEAMAQALFKSWFVDFDPVIDNALAAGNPIPEPLEARANARAALGDARKPLPDAIQRQFPNRFIFNDEIGWVPEGWEVRSVANAIQVNPKVTLSKGALAPFADMKALPTSGFGIQNVIEKEFNGGAKFLQGDVLFARITPCLENGKTGIVDFLEADQAGFGSTEFIVMRGSGVLRTAFVACLARDDRFRKHCELGMVGSSGRQRVQNSSFDSFFLCLPADGRVQELFDRFASPNFARMSRDNAESLTLVKLRDTLLPKLLSGQLRVPEAERQVAEVL